MPVPPPSAYPPGTALTVGSHDVVTEQFIGEGGFAHVYTVRVSPPIPGQEIACLKRVQVPNKTYLNLLRAEVEAMQRLKGSSNIVDYYDSHAERMKEPHSPGQYEVFLLMEYCSRGGLIDFMNTRLRDQLREHEILKIMYDITLGVSHMHYLAPPLLHRDLKIENVLIRGDGTYMLCDFGSASPVLRTPKNPAEFRILEDDIQHHTTVQYRAPEMIDLSLGHPIDEKSDIWALGIFLYKLCYYTTPFERPNQTLEQFQALILTASYTIPPRPAYSERLRNMIRILLQPDPRLRPNIFQVMQEVCAMRNVECPIQDIYSRPRPVVQPITMPGLQMIPGPAHQQPAAIATPPVVTPMQTVPPIKSQPIQLPPQAATMPPVNSLQMRSESEPLSSDSTGSNDDSALYETEDELAARYPSVEEIDRTMSFSSAKVPRHSDLAGGDGPIAGPSAGGTPMGSAPVGSAPVGSAPVGGTPGGTTPVGTAPLGGTPLVSAPITGAVKPGQNSGSDSGRSSKPLIDLDSPPSKVLSQRDTSLLKANAQPRSQIPPTLPKKPTKPPRLPVKQQSPSTDYPMPQRPRGSHTSLPPSRQTSPIRSGSSDDEVNNVADDNDSQEEIEPLPESRMNLEASKLKQILTGISERPSTVIMDKPEEDRSLSSVDFLRSLGNDGSSAHHHPHLHLHSKSRKHSLFYNSASIGTTRHMHSDEEDEDEDEEEDAYEYGGVHMRVGQLSETRPDDAYVTTDDEGVDSDQRFDFSDSAPASPLSPGNIVPVQAPAADTRLPRKPAKPQGVRPSTKPVNVPSQATKPTTKPTSKPPGKPSKLAAKPGDKVSAEPPRLAPKPVHFSGQARISIATHSTSDLGAFKPTNSIQQRVRALLNGHDRQHPPVRTAKGYGRYTDSFEDDVRPAARSRSMGSEVREVREIRAMAPSVPSRDSKPKAQLPRSFSAQSLVKHK